MNRTRIALTAAFLSLAASASPQEVWFPTGPPEFRVPGPEVATGGAPMLTPSEYKQIAWDDRQPLRELPESLSEAARFGYNFVYAETNRHFAVDRTNDGRFILYPDMNVTVPRHECEREPARRPTDGVGTEGWLSHTRVHSRRDGDVGPKRSGRFWSRTCVEPGKFCQVQW